VLLSEIGTIEKEYEDTQEQNGHLLQQLREKNDANAQLINEKIKANQLQSLLKEENCYTTLKNQSSEKTNLAKDELLQKK